MNSRLINALGIVALCYILLQLGTWILNSVLSITAGFGYWLRYTVTPHAWQIAIALGILYLLYTAITSSDRRL